MEILPIGRNSVCLPLGSISVVVCTEFCAPTARCQLPVDTPAKTKNMSIERKRPAAPRALPAVLDYAYRPMFLVAGSWWFVGLALWLAMFFGYVQLPTRFDPLAWHVHEMVLLMASACWIGFGVLELVYGPMLLSRRSAS